MSESKPRYTPGYAPSTSRGWRRYFRLVDTNESAARTRRSRWQNAPASNPPRKSVGL